MAQSLFDTLTQTADGAVLRLPAVLSAESLSRLDFDHVPALAGNVRFDAGDVKECDSAGIAALLWLMQRCVKQGAQPVFTGLSEPVIKLLNLYNLHNRDLIFNAGTTD